jgi:membrane protease YdiL (CAAX protease family)
VNFPTNLRPREKAGLVIGLVALAASIGHANLDVRLWLRDDLAGGAPYWLDNMLFMQALKVLVWGALGFLLLGRAGLGLALPVRPKEAWFVAFATGVGLVGAIALALALAGMLAIHVSPNWPVIFANFVSNFFEELIFRGAILGLLLAIVGRQRAFLAAGISAVLFCQGHLHYPAPLLVLTFGVGLLWAWMTIRYRSILPAWLSHTVVDAVADSVFRL